MTDIHGLTLRGITKMTELVDDASTIKRIDQYKLAAELMYRTHEFIGCGNMSMGFNSETRSFILIWSSEMGTRGFSHSVSLNDIDHCKCGMTLLAEWISKRALPCDSSMTDSET